MTSLSDIQRSAQQSADHEQYQHRLTQLLRRLAGLEPNGQMIWEASTLARRAADHAVKQHPQGFGAPVEELHQEASRTLRMLAQNPR
jgi:hypothetical protein